MYVGEPMSWISHSLNLLTKKGIEQRLTGGTKFASDVLVSQLFELFSQVGSSIADGRASLTSKL